VGKYYGLKGESQGQFGGAGIFGMNGTASNTGSGVYGWDNAGSGYGMVAENPNNSADNGLQGAALWIRGRILLSPSGANPLTQNDSGGTATFTLPVPQSSCRVNIVTSKPASATYTITVGNSGKWVNTTTVALVTIYSQSAAMVYSVSTLQDQIIIHFSPNYAFTGAEWLNFVLINQN
jgi:hypothetical protein